MRGPTVPVLVDKAEIQRIAARTREKFERERDHCLELIRRCDAVIEAAPELPLLDRNQHQQQRHDLQVRADAITRHLPRWRFWQRYGLLLAADRAGVSLRYTSSGKDGPAGPGID